MATGSGDYINFSEERMEDAVKACKNGISITQFSWGTACNLIWPTPLVHAYLGVKPKTIFFKNDITVIHDQFNSYLPCYNL